MKTYILSLILFIAFNSSAQSLENGEKIFNTNCKACHSLGGGRLVGPDLAGITERRSTDWIIKFIANSSELIQSGDEQAKAIFEEYNKITMPAHPFSDDEFNDLIAFMGSYTPEQVKAEPVAVSNTTEPTDQQGSVIEAVVVPTWIKVFLSGTLVLSIALLVIIGFLLKVIKGF